MKYRAKTYLQFINEAYIDDFGELRDFNYPSEDEPEFQVLNQAQIISEYLEESGAERVKIGIDDEIIDFKFKYRGYQYVLVLNLDTDSAFVSTGNELIYHDNLNSFFDLLAAVGLEFLNAQ
jgi:hypothetical protein